MTRLPLAVLILAQACSAGTRTAPSRAETRVEAKASPTEPAPNQDAKKAAQEPALAAKKEDSAGPVGSVQPGASAPGGGAAPTPQKPQELAGQEQDKSPVKDGDGRQGNGIKVVAEPPTSEEANNRFNALEKNWAKAKSAIAAFDSDPKNLSNWEQAHQLVSACAKEAEQFFYEHPGFSDPNQRLREIQDRLSYLQDRKP